MKNILTLLFLLIILMNANAQLDTNCDEEGFEVAITRGIGGFTPQPKITDHESTPFVYFSYGDDSNSFNKENIVLTKFDPSSQLICPKKYDQLPSLFNQDITVTSGGSTYTLNGGNGIDRAHLKKVDDPTTTSTNSTTSFNLSTQIAPIDCYKNTISIIDSMPAPPPECGTNSFQMRFSKPGEFVYLTRVIESNNAPLAACSQTITGGGDVNTLAQFDNQGQVIWSKDYNYEDQVRLNELLKTSDGGILINNDAVGESILQKTDADGNWQWSKKYEYDSQYTRFSTVISEDNGDIMLAGQTQGGGIGGNRGILLRTNSLGDVIWEKRYATDIEGSEALYLNDMIQTPAGNYIVAGAGAITQPIIASFSSSGEFLWGKYFDPLWPFANQSIVLNEDQTSFYLLYESNPEANIGIAEFDFAGNQLFVQEYSVNGNLTPGHLTVLDDGSLIINGDFQFSFSGARSPFFLRLDANKEVVSAVKLVISGNQYTIENAAKTHTVIGGTIYSVYEGTPGGMMHALSLSLESECPSEEVEVSYTNVSLLGTDLTLQEIEGELNVEDLTPQVSDISLIQSFACESSTSNDFFTSETLQFCAGETAEILGNQYTDNTTIEENLTSVNGCDSTHQIELVFLEEIFSSETIAACEGETVTIFGNEYTSAGVFQETFESSLGCDSTHQITLIFNQPTFQNEVFQACEGDVVTVFGVPVTESGDYSDIFVGSNGCDSTLTISLTFLENVLTSETIEACEGETVNIYGNDYTDNTIVQGNFNTSTNCDSTHSITLLFLEDVQSFETIEACEGEIVTILGQSISENIVIDEVLPAANGCDSTHFISVVFTETINTFENITGCANESVIVLGNEIFTNTIIEETFISNFGCDSIHQITVSFLEEINTYEIVEACQGETVTIFGNEYTSSGIFEETFSSFLDCDSTHQISLIFNQPTFQNEFFQACEGDVVTVFGVPVTESGDYSDVFVGSNGCDSTLTISLIFLEDVFTSETIELCEGETASIFGNNYTENAIVEQTFNTTANCDSTHTITLIFLENIQTTEIIEACEGETLNIFGQTITENTNVEQTFIAENGCDSTHIITVIFTNVINTFETITACTGEEIEVFGNEISEDAVLEEIFLSNFGCDSIHQVTVVFLEGVNTFETLEFCEGETATIFGNDYIENDVAEQSFLAANGCDSIHQVTLIFNETFETTEIFELCEGESIFIFGNEIINSQNLSETFTAINGCDSTHQVSITFFENVFTFETQEYCEGETAVIFGENVEENDVLVENFNTQNGCDSLHEITVIFNEEINIFLYDTICFGDSLLVFDEFIFNTGSYEFLSSGIGEDCDTSTYLNLEVLPEIQYELSLDTIISVGMSWQIPLQTSNENLFFEWLPTDNLSCIDCQNPIALAEENLTYTVFITNELGCSSSAQIKVALDPIPAFFIPQAFSPNNDETNDYFTIFGNEKIEIIEEMQIFDRWGTLIFTQQNFPPNKLEAGWDGTYRGQKLNTGVFVYTIRLRQLDGRVIEEVGDILLIY